MTLTLIIILTACGAFCLGGAVYTAYMLITASEARKKATQSKYGERLEPAPFFCSHDVR